jgi:hypothetical protein
VTHLTSVEIATKNSPEMGENYEGERVFHIAGFQLANYHGCYQRKQVAPHAKQIESKANAKIGSQPSETAICRRAR